MLDAGRFARLWSRLGCVGDAEPHWQSLVRAYEEPHRSYHNSEHIVDCLTQFDETVELADRPDEVEVALWYHDVVYDPRAADNEERSADRAGRALAGCGACAAVVERVGRLIRATSHQAPPTDADALFVVDVDLSILGRAPAEFDAYDGQIRPSIDGCPSQNIARLGHGYWRASLSESTSITLFGFAAALKSKHVIIFDVLFDGCSRRKAQVSTAELVVDSDARILACARAGQKESRCPGVEQRLWPVGSGSSRFGSSVVLFLPLDESGDIAAADVEVALDCLALGTIMQIVESSDHFLDLLRVDLLVDFFPFLFGADFRRTCDPPCTGYPTDFDIGTPPVLASASVVFLAIIRQLSCWSCAFWAVTGK